MKRKVRITRMTKTIGYTVCPKDKMSETPDPNDLTGQSLGELTVLWRHKKSKNGGCLLGVQMLMRASGYYSRE